MKWLKKLFGIKEYSVCSTCGMVFEPDPNEILFNLWCPEHRKPYIEQRNLEEWAKGWAHRKPEEARKAKAMDDIEMSKLKIAYSQELGKALNQQTQNANANNNFGMIGGWPFGGLK